LLFTVTVTSDWYHVIKSTSQAPTGTLLSYYSDIQQEIVHELLLEEFDASKKWVIIMDRRQD